MISGTDNTGTAFLYNGRDGVMADANGLYYMRARYYSPELKRFINADVVAGDIANAITLNRYAYANGNPVSNVDPFGLEAERSKDRENKESVFGRFEDFINKPLLKEELKAICNLQYRWQLILPIIHSVGNIRLEVAFDKIDYYRDTIFSISEKYDVPEEIIASIILKEQYTQSIPDWVANLDTNYGTHSSHSVGLGAIFPNTAIEAWKWYNPSAFDTLPSDSAQMQKLLTQDEQFNIETIAVVLLYEKSHLQNPEDYNDSDVSWHSILTRYNGDSEYADKVLEYLPKMKEYLSYD